MRRISKKTADRETEARPFREQLKLEIGHCEICHHNPKEVQPGQVAWALHVHEIARGAHRLKALDKRFAVLVLCYPCHIDGVHGIGYWPEARQLAALMKSRDHDYNLIAYNRLINPDAPRRVTQTEVDVWLAQIELPRRR